MYGRNVLLLPEGRGAREGVEIVHADRAERELEVKAPAGRLGGRPLKPLKTFSSASGGGRAAAAVRRRGYQPRAGGVEASFTPSWGRLRSRRAVLRRFGRRGAGARSSPALRLSRARSVSRRWPVGLAVPLSAVLGGVASGRLAVLVAERGKHGGLGRHLCHLGCRWAWTPRRLDGRCDGGCGGSRCRGDDLGFAWPGGCGGRGGGRWRRLLRCSWS